MGIEGVVIILKLCKNTRAKKITKFEKEKKSVANQYIRYTVKNDCLKGKFDTV
jgi:hypothetical protein